MTHLDDAVFEEEEDLFTLLFIFFFPEKEEDNKGEEDARKRWCAVEDAVMVFLSQFCGICACLYYRDEVYEDIDIVVSSFLSCFFVFRVLV